MYIVEGSHVCLIQKQNNALLDELKERFKNGGFGLKSFVTGGVADKKIDEKLKLRDVEQAALVDPEVSKQIDKIVLLELDQQILEENGHNKDLKKRTEIFELKGKFLNETNAAKVYEQRTELVQEALEIAKKEVEYEQLQGKEQDNDKKSLWQERKELVVKRISPELYAKVKEVAQNLKDKGLEVKSVSGDGRAISSASRSGPGKPGIGGRSS